MVANKSRQIKIRLHYTLTTLESAWKRINKLTGSSRM